VAGDRESALVEAKRCLASAWQILDGTDGAASGVEHALSANPDGWFSCYGDMYEYQRILVYDASGTKAGNYEIERR
jgi:hypothetical protein